MEKEKDFSFRLKLDYTNSTRVHIRKGRNMSKKATEFQRKSMGMRYRGKEIFKPMNTGWIDDSAACVRERVANIFFCHKGNTVLMIDAGYSFISSLSESSKTAVELLRSLEGKLRPREKRPVSLTGHTGWTDSFDFAFAHRDRLCSIYKKKVHDPNAIYDAYDESDDTRDNAEKGYIPVVGMNCRKQ